MRRYATLLWIFVVACVGLTPTSARAADTFTFDKAHTSILFMIDHLGFSKMVGEFRDFDGTFVIDEANPANSHVDVTIHTASVDTDVPELDEKLRSVQFFDTKKFPAATFKSTRVEKTGDTTAKVYGDFTLLGVTKPLVLDVTLNKIGMNTYVGKKHAGFSVRTHFFRSAHHMNEYLPMIGDRVDILIEIEGFVADAAGAPAPAATKN